MCASHKKISCKGKQEVSLDSGTDVSVKLKKPDEDKQTSREESLEKIIEVDTKKLEVADRKIVINIFTAPTIIAYDLHKKEALANTLGFIPSLKTLNLLRDIQRTKPLLHYLSTLLMNLSHNPASSPASCSRTSNEIESTNINVMLLKVHCNLASPIRP